MAGICYYKTKKYKRSLSIFNEYLKNNNNTTEIDYYKGLCYYYLNNFNDAAIYLNKVSLVDKNDENIRKINKGYYALDKKREAKKIVNKLYYLDKTLYNQLKKKMK